jgi:chemotaxis protein CheX
MNDKINTILLDPFVRSLENALMTMVGVRKLNKISVLYNPKEKPKTDIYGLMGISGAMTGNFVLCLQEPVARKLVSNMLEVDPSELLEEEVYDGVGELVNMICCPVKAEYKNMGIDIDTSLPAIIVGKNAEVIYHHDAVSSGVMFFDVDGQELIIQIIKEI